MRPTTSSAALALAGVALVGCGDGVGGQPPRSYSSVEARRIVHDFVDETVRATAAGFTTKVRDEGRTPDACSPPGESHNWPYDVHIDANGERAKKLVDDVAAYWRSKGYEVTVTSEPGALVGFDHFAFGIHPVGSDGAGGLTIGGSSPCLPGEGSPVP